MRIDIVGRNLEITPAIKAHAEGKLAKLPRYFDGVQSIVLTLSRDDHKHTAQFAAELIVDVEKHDDFVSHAHGEDVYLLIDEAVHKGSRQLTDFKEKLKQGKR